MESWVSNTAKDVGRGTMNSLGKSAYRPPPPPPPSSLASLARENFVAHAVRAPDFGWMLSYTGTYVFSAGEDTTNPPGEICTLAFVCAKLRCNTLPQTFPRSEKFERDGQICILFGRLVGWPICFIEQWRR